MKVLMIAAGPISIYKKYVSNEPPNSSGKWIDAMIFDMEQKGIEIGFACKDQRDVFDLHEKDYTFYAVKKENKINRGNKIYKPNIFKWQKIIKHFKPDIIFLWGSEYLTQREVVEANNKKIPVILFVQGVIRAFMDKKHGLITNKEILQKIGLYGLIKWVIKKKDYQILSKQTISEKKTFNNVSAVIVDNEWAKNQSLILNDNLSFYYYNLPIDQSVFNHQWQIDKIERHSIFSLYALDIYKGASVLLKAFAIVVKKYPDAKLYMPGFIELVKKRNIWQKIKMNPYIMYLKKIIKQNKMESNIVYMPLVNSQEMAERMTHCHVFCAPSMIENQSSTLREAMLVGCPCIAASSGAMPEVFAKSQQDFLYDYLDYQTLANLIMKVFENDEVAVNLANDNHNLVFNRYQEKQDILEILKHCMNNHQ